MGKWFKSKARNADSLVALETLPPYGVAEFSIKHGLSIVQARHILRKSQTREEADDAVRAQREHPEARQQSSP